MPTPQQYLERCLVQLDLQRAHAREFDPYYTGDRRLELIDREYADVFGYLPQARDLLALRPPTPNVAAVGVDALGERLQVQNFTSVGAAPATLDGAPGAQDGAEADTAAEDAAMAVWRGSDMDVMQGVATLEALVKGRSFLLNSPGPDGVVMSVEDPEQVAVLRSHVPPYDVVAAVKIHADPWGGPDLGQLWLPGQRIPLTRNTTGAGWAAGTAVPSPAAVPVHELAYRQRLLTEPTSYIQPVAHLSDAYAVLMAYLTIAARFGAIPIRTATGITLPRDSRDPSRVLPLGTDPDNPDVRVSIGVQRALASENPNAKFGQLDAGRLGEFISALDMLLGSIVSVTRVPQHYYGAGAKSGTSGEMLKASESGLTRRTEDVQRYFGSTHRRAMSQAVAMELGRPVQLTPRWANTETLVEAQLADAAGKYQAAGVPLSVALERVGWPADLVARATEGASTDASRANALLEQLTVLGGAGGSTPTAQPVSAEPAAPAVVDTLGG